jgi:hypothetical protein
MSQNSCFLNYQQVIMSSTDGCNEMTSSFKQKFDQFPNIPEPEKNVFTIPVMPSSELYKTHLNHSDDPRRKKKNAHRFPLRNRNKQRRKQGCRLRRSTTGKSATDPKISGNANNQSGRDWSVGI